MPLSDRQFRERQEIMQAIQRAEADCARAERVQAASAGRLTGTLNPAIQNAVAPEPTPLPSSAATPIERSLDFWDPQAARNRPFVWLSRQGISSRSMEDAIDYAFGIANTRQVEPHEYTFNIHGVDPVASTYERDNILRFITNGLQTIESTKSVAEPAMSLEQAKQEVSEEEGIAWLKSTPWG